MNPVISVIIPSLNEEKLIAKCLESVVSQTYQKDKFEIIVVDSNSRDRTVEIVKTFPAKVYIYQDTKSIGDARQRGVAHARGEILAFIDSDSVAERAWLEKIDLLLSDERLVAVAGVAIPLTHNSIISLLFSFYNAFLRLHGVFGVVLPWGFNLAVRKKAFEKIGGFNVALSTGEDWDIGLQVKKTFGKESIIYSQELRVKTSTRKQEDTVKFLAYVWNGVINYLNIVVLNKRIAKQAITVR